MPRRRGAVLETEYERAGSQVRSQGTGKPGAALLLDTPGALLTRTHLRELGLGRAAVDAVFRALPVIVFPGSTRPHVRRDDYVELVKASAYDDSRVRLTER